MRKYRLHALTFLGVALMVVSFTSVSLAQIASGVPGDQIDDIPVTIGGVKELFTAVRDSADPNQWYYVPDKPRVSESQGADGKAEPDFTLIRYDMRDPENPTKAVSGGVLVFSARLSVPADAHNQIVEAISKKTNNNTFRLGPIPIKSSQIHMYAPDGKFVTSAAQGEGVGPAFSSQKMTFSVNLTQVGTQVLDAMSGSAGIPVYVHIKYPRLTPKMGFKIKVNWKSLRDFYSSDHQFRAQASYYGLAGGSANIQASNVKDTLVRGGHISIESVTGETFTPADVDRIMQPLITRINQTLLDMSTAPAAITPAAAQLTEAKGYFASAQYGFAMKKQVNISSLNETIDYTTRSIETAETLASGLIGIGSYSEEIKGRHIVNIKPGQYSRVYFILPPVGDDIGISNLTLEVDCRVGDGPPTTQTATWTKETGNWHDTNSPIQYVWFPLQSLTGDDPEKIKKLKFESFYHLVLGGQMLTHRQVREGLTGNVPLVPAQTVANVITINAIGLPWKKLDPQNGKVDEVNIVLKAGGKTFSANIAPIKLDTKWTDPPLKRMLVERGASVVPTVHFRLASGERIPWKENGKAIIAGEEGDYAVSFYDSDLSK